MNTVVTKVVDAWYLPALNAVVNDEAIVEFCRTNFSKLVDVENAEFENVAWAFDADHEFEGDPDALHVVYSVPEWDCLECEDKITDEAYTQCDEHLLEKPFDVKRVTAFI